MPARSIAQQRLMAAAEHGAKFPMAKKLRASMSHQQLHDFASGKQKGKPMHVKRHNERAEHERGRADNPTEERRERTPHPGGYGARMRAGMK